MRRFFLIVIFFSVFSCSKKAENETIPAKENKKFEMYEMSEMAILMEQMYVNNTQLKSRIIEKTYLGNFPNHFLDIHTAVMTEKQENDDFFKENAKLYILEQQKVYADPENAQIHFNNSIDVCIKCHQEKCTGPIQRIKKLYIK